MELAALAIRSLARAAAALILLVGVAAMVWFLSRVRTSDRPMGWQEHFEDLRRRLIVSVAALFVLAAFFFSFRWPQRSWYPEPALHDTIAAQVFRTITAHLVPDNVQLVVIRPMDGFLAEMGIAFGLAVVVGMPVLVHQLGGFFMPALREREKRVLRRAFVPVFVLFLAGAAFAYWLVLPFLFETLYGYGTALGATPFLQVSELVTFSMGLMVVFGLAFQLPLVMYALSRVGIVQAATWRRTWKHALVGIIIASALLTDPTIVSQLLVAAPLILLYGVGTFLAARGEATHARQAPGAS